jgi:hypothetical protein
MSEKMTPEQRIRWERQLEKVREAEEQDAARITPVRCPPVAVRRG